MTRLRSIAGQRETLPATEASLARLSAFVAERMGLNFPRERWKDLARGLRGAAREFGYEDEDLCAQWVVSSALSKAEMEILASYLTVGETYFFRAKAGLDALTERILPGLVVDDRRRERHLKVWSAGCATGEEAYSIAMQLSVAMRRDDGWKASIFATDLNTRFLDKARKGIYGEWSFRDTPSWIKGRCFRSIGKDKFEILPHIKRMVDFEYLNLAEDVYPSLLNNIYGMDVIFCRNVLMYFVPEQAAKVLRGFYRALVDGGWLVVGSSDLLQLKRLGFTQVDPRDSSILRKDSSGTSASQQSGVPAPALSVGSSQYYEGPRRQAAEYLTSSCGPGTAPTFQHPEPEASAHPEAEIACPISLEPAPEQDVPYAESMQLYLDGHYTEAGDKLAGAISSAASAGACPDDGKAMMLLARARANQGELDEAMEWCEKAIEANREEAFGYYLRASILQEQGRLDEAARSVRQALFLEPDFVLGYFTQGMLARSQGKAKESERHFTNALTLLADYPDDAILPESEGVTAGRLTTIIEAMTQRST